MHIKGVIRYLHPLMPALIGLCFGITFKLMYVPYSYYSCKTYITGESYTDMGRFQETRVRDRAVKLLKEPDRPKYASVELGIRKKLFVAVLTSKETFHMFCVAFKTTVHRHVSKMMFFSNSKIENVPQGVSVVIFSDKHQRHVPINTLKYLSKHYTNQFDYYMFVTDQTYIQGVRLFELVSSISVSQHVHLGATRISERGEKYCSPEGGVILSQSLLSQVVSQTNRCARKFSDNLGMCLLITTGRNCQGVAQGKVFGHYRIENFDFERDIDRLRKNENFNNSISVYPIPDETNFYKLYRYFCEVELNRTKMEIERIQEDIFYMSSYLPGGRDSISWPLGVPEPYKPKTRFDVIRWTYFTETHIFFKDDVTNVEELKDVDKEDTRKVIRLSVDHLNQKYKNKFLYLRLINGYRRFDPQRGMEYILDIALNDTTDQNKQVEKRIQIVRPLGQVDIVPMPETRKNTTVNLILPVSDDDEHGLDNFLRSYTKICQQKNDKTNLLIVLIYRYGGNMTDVFSVLKSTVSYYERYCKNGAKISWTPLYTNSSYISEFAIMDVVSQKFSEDDLLLICSVGMELATEYLNRVRINSIQEWQVFFPVGFWQYKPNLVYIHKPYPKTVEIKPRTGHYDIHSFEHCSFYKSDYTAAVKVLYPYDTQTHSLYDMFVKYKKVHVFRAIEPDLRHRYKSFKCASSMPEPMYERCKKRRSEGLATRGQLAKLVFEKQLKEEQHQLEMLKNKKTR